MSRSSPAAALNVHRSCYHNKKLNAQSAVVAPTLRASLTSHAHVLMPMTAFPAQLTSTKKQMTALIILASAPAYHNSKLKRCLLQHQRMDCGQQRTIQMNHPALSRAQNMSAQLTLLISNFPLLSVPQDLCTSRDIPKLMHSNLFLLPRVHLSHEHTIHRNFLP